jgi:hypothetical protein
MIVESRAEELQPGRAWMCSVLQQQVQQPQRAVLTSADPYGPQTCFIDLGRPHAAGSRGRDLQDSGPAGPRNGVPSLNAYAG